MSPQTERRLEGHKVFVHPDGDSIALHAVTDSHPVTRLVFDLDIKEAIEIAQMILNAAVEVEANRHG